MRADSRRLPAEQQDDLAVDASGRALTHPMRRGAAEVQLQTADVQAKDKDHQTHQETKTD